MEPFCVKRFIIIIIIIEIGLESTQRSCPHCHLHVETEIHHLLDCPFYNDLRKIMLAYIIDLGREDRLKFLIDTPDKAIINCVAKYVFLFIVLKENQIV